ncbi:H0502G05.11 protein [Theobroma cacao]|uniref:RNA-directed DNA polymerase n=1 Tax=Theobroma cacao TaxID=3641 RepID=A0A061ELX9_THECC|nr:H0502G05.11 protein [Theobroma cacao]
MESSIGNQDAPVPSYIQDLMRMIQTSQERMQILEDNNKRMMDTISQFASSTVTTFQAQSVHPNESAPAGVTHLVTNIEENGGNGEGAADVVVAANPNPTNTTIAVTLTTTSTALPYPASVAAKPYPKDYTSLMFKQFNGKTGDAREHVMKFVETLGVAGLDDDLKLKEFSKSLTEKAYTWYVNLTPGSVQSWNQMCRMFGEKFFSTQEKVTLVDLGREFQKSREDLMEYIQRFRERVLDIQESHDEKELVKVCIQGMFDEYRLHLENLPLPTFATLVEAARRTNNTVFRQKGLTRFGRRNNPTVNAIQGGGRERRGPIRANLRPRRDVPRRGLDEENDSSPPFSVPLDRVRALLQEWVRDGQINLPYTPRPPTAKEKANPRYCDYHRTVGHPLAECRNLRRMFHRRVQAGEVLIGNNRVQNNPLPIHPNPRGQVSAIIHAHHDDPSSSNTQFNDANEATRVTSSIANSLMKTPSFRHFFDQLGFSEEARKEAAISLVQIAGEQYGECNLIERPMGKMVGAYKNAIVFTEADMCTPHPYHNKPLYVESTINGYPIRRTFIDDGSSVNLIPLSTLKAVNMDLKSLRRPMAITSFDNKEIITLGQVTVNFKMGPIQDQTCFHVIDANVAYHALIGRKFLHMHNIIPSSRHQCIKGYWKGKEVFILATKAPFERHEPPDTSPSCFQVEAEKEKVQEVLSTKEQLSDQPKPQGDELEEINMAEEGETSKPLFISKSLSGEQKVVLIELLRKFQDVFAWTYEQMLGLDENLITHELHISPQSKPVKQHARVFHHEIEGQIKEEINKLLKVGFIKPIHYPTWLANVVPVKKKNGTIRVCVDFRDLNKACPKDDFPLPNIDTLVDATVGHEMFSFMDGFSGYNQIKMAREDAEKTAFRTPFGNFYYTVMPFGLKNAGATYQRAMTAIFHDMMHDFMEDYVDDIVVKSKKAFNHFEDLKKEMDGEEKPVYYISRCLHRSELNYPPMEKHCLALVYTTQKLRHYFLAHKLIIVTKSDPIKFLLSKPVLSGRVAKWLLLLGEFDVSVVQPKAIKSQALSDLLAYFPSQFEEIIPDAIPVEFHEEVCTVNIEEGEWSLYFDGSSNSFGGGAGIVLIPPNREDNSAVQSSELVVSHLSRGHISLERKGLRVLEAPSEDENFLISCLELNSFESSREPISELLLPPIYDKEDWRKSIIKELLNPSSTAIPRLKHYILIHGTLYHKGSNGVLARCVSEEEAKERLRIAHEQWCGEEGPPLHRLIQRAGYFWPSMSKDALQLQKACIRCSEPPDVQECNFVGSAGDWRRPYIDFFQNGILPANFQDARQLKRRAQRFFLKGNDLFRLSFAGTSLKYVSPADVNPFSRR